MIIRFTPEAETDLTEAREWHTSAKIWTWNSCSVLTTHRRESFALLTCIQMFTGTLRRAVIQRFPFAVFYEVTTDEIQVIAVFHSRRDPEMWKSRVTNPELTNPEWTNPE
jgi:plasmid stabilization system protein ParE